MGRKSAIVFSSNRVWGVFVPLCLLGCQGGSGLHCADDRKDFKKPETLATVVAMAKVRQEVCTEWERVYKQLDAIRAQLKEAGDGAKGPLTTQIGHLQTKDWCLARLSEMLWIATAKAGVTENPVCVGWDIRRDILSNWFGDVPPENRLWRLTYGYVDIESVRAIKDEDWTWKKVLSLLPPKGWAARMQVGQPETRRRPETRP